MAIDIESGAIDTTEESEAISGDVLENSGETGAKRKADKYHELAIVTKSNNLIQKTKYALPRNEQKILLTLMSKIDPKNDTDANKEYSITFGEFSKLTGLNALDAHYMKYMQDTVQSLEDRSFWIELPGNKRKIMSWLARGSEVDLKKKTITCKFNGDMWPELSQLNRNYTSYSVEYLLTMTSTYSMRFYEILLSYDNGDSKREYNNGLIFQPVTKEILEKFPDKAADIQNFKYKVFSIQDLREQLSPPPLERKEKKETTSSREKPLTEKYLTFGEFEKNVLKRAKSEINEMTDLYMDYIPVRKRGERKFSLLYLFIRYKTADEMAGVRAFHKGKSMNDEIPRRTAGTSRRVVDKLKAPGVLLDDSILDLTLTMVIRILSEKAEFENIRETLPQDIAAAESNAFSYLAKVLTNKKKRENAIEKRDALNRVIEQYKTLKTWGAGMGGYLKEQQEAGRLKSPQYNAAVVANAIEDATIIPTGEKILSGIGTPDLFHQDFAKIFDED